jgi:hypothetical protein
MKSYPPSVVYGAVPARPVGGTVGMWNIDVGSAVLHDPGISGTGNVTIAEGIYATSVPLYVSTDQWEAAIKKAEALLHRLETICARLEGIGHSPNESPEPREISDAEAKAEIKNIFDSHNGEVLYPSDVAHQLNLDYDTVVRLLDELEAEGRIKST